MSAMRAWTISTRSSGEKRESLPWVPADGDDEPVEQGAAAGDDVQVAQRDGVKRAGVERQVVGHAGKSSAGVREEEECGWGVEWWGEVHGSGTKKASRQEASRRRHYWG